MFDLVGDVDHQSGLLVVARQTGSGRPFFAEAGLDQRAIG
jgi:hypothetical protein